MFRERSKVGGSQQEGGGSKGSIVGGYMEGGSRKGNSTSTTTTTTPRRVMVVVELTRESAGALQYALRHGVVERDELILLYLDSPNSWRNTISTLFRRSNTISVPAGGGGGNASGTFTLSSPGEGGESNFLEETRRACEVAQPSVKVRTEKVEMVGGKDKASLILLQSKLHEVDVLIIGQKRSLSTALLGTRSKRGVASQKGSKQMDTAEYLIENCSCTCVAVQRKGQNAGYLLNTKTFKNFWLLA